MREQSRRGCHTPTRAHAATARPRWQTSDNPPDSSRSFARCDLGPVPDVAHQTMGDRADPARPGYRSCRRSSHQSHQVPEQHIPETRVAGNTIAPAPPRTPSITLTSSHSWRSSSTTIKLIAKARAVRCCRTAGSVREPPVAEEPREVILLHPLLGFPHPLVPVAHSSSPRRASTTRGSRRRGGPASTRPSSAAKRPA